MVWDHVHWFGNCSLGFLHTVAVLRPKEGVLQSRLVTSSLLSASVIEAKDERFDQTTIFPPHTFPLRRVDSLSSNAACPEGAARRPAPAARRVGRRCAGAVLGELFEHLQNGLQASADGSNHVYAEPDDRRFESYEFSCIPQ